MLHISQPNTYARESLKFHIDNITQPYMKGKTGGHRNWYPARHPQRSEDTGFSFHTVHYFVSKNNENITLVNRERSILLGGSSVRGWNYTPTFCHEGRLDEHCVITQASG
jgi:hypothetical protein